MKNIHAYGSLLALSLVIQSTPLQADLNNSVYVPVEPCRVGDTRGTGTTKITAGSNVEWLAYGDDMSTQGGAGSPGCPQPKTDMKPIGVALNVTVVGNQATGNGNVVAYPADGATPSSSLVNYKPGTNIANSTIVGLCQDGICDGKFKIQSNISDVPVIADVQGYFYPAPGNVANVALSGGDYTSPVDAMADVANWCGTPSATNQCLVKIAPGVYTITGSALVMVPYVDIRGSGRRATLLQGPIAVGTGWTTSNAIVWGASDATLSDMSITNIGGIGNAAAVFNSGASPRLERLSLEASGAIENAVHNTNNASPSITSSKLKVPTDAVALYNWSNSNPTVKSCTLVGGIGVWTKGGSSTSIERSKIQAPIVTVRNDGFSGSSTTNVFASTLDGGPADVINGGSAPKCAGVTDENNDFTAGPVCP